MTNAVCRRQFLDETICSDDLPRRLARIYARILARAADEEVTTDERPQVATSALEAMAATGPGQIQEIINGGDENEQEV